MRRRYIQTDKSSRLAPGPTNPPQGRPNEVIHRYGMDHPDRYERALFPVQATSREADTRHSSDSETYSIMHG